MFHNLSSLKPLVLRIRYTTGSLASWQLRDRTPVSEDLSTPNGKLSANIEWMLLKLGCTALHFAFESFFFREASYRNERVAVMGEIALSIIENTCFNSFPMEWRWVRRSQVLQEGHSRTRRLVWVPTKFCTRLKPSNVVGLGWWWGERRPCSWLLVNWFRVFSARRAKRNELERVVFGACQSCLPVGSGLRYALQQETSLRSLLWELAAG